VPLSSIMRRLLTGYALSYNLRHHRCGHLFQNRYKSILCEEDPYLRELIRYIHLNPLRAGLVEDSEELGRYPYGDTVCFWGMKEGSGRMQTVFLACLLGGGPLRGAGTFNFCKRGSIRAEGRIW